MLGLPWSLFSKFLSGVLGFTFTWLSFVLERKEGRKKEGKEREGESTVESHYQVLHNTAGTSIWNSFLFILFTAKEAVLNNG